MKCFFVVFPLLRAEGPECVPQNKTPRSLGRNETPRNCPTHPGPPARNRAKEVFLSIVHLYFYQLTIVFHSLLLGAGGPQCVTQNRTPRKIPLAQYTQYYTIKLTSTILYNTIQYKHNTIYIQQTNKQRL